MPPDRRIILLTDIPKWVEPLAEALRARGAAVLVETAPEASSVSADLLVNRVSTLLMRREPARATAFESSLVAWEHVGGGVVNSARCLRLGYSKQAQASLFRDCGVSTPETRLAIPGGRALPGRAVLLKPAAGGFGKGIRALDLHEPAPEDLDPAAGWVEQERLVPVDGAVHRLEMLGGEILYEASSPLVEGDFNYCLASGDPSVRLRARVEPALANTARHLAEAAGMELGALEYLNETSGTPTFIDLNPVSSLYPNAPEFLGFDPLERTADFLVRRAAKTNDGF